MIPTTSVPSGPRAHPAARSVVRLVRSRWWTAGVLVGAGLCLLGGADTWLWVLGGLVIAGCIARQLVVVAISWRREALSGIVPLPALALAVSLGAWFWTTDDGHHGLTAFDTLAVVVTALLTGLLTTADAAVLQTAHLPGAPTVLPRRVGPDRLAVVLVVSLGSGFVTAVVDARIATVVVVSTGALVAVVLSGVHQPPTRRYRRQVQQALDAWAPVFVLPYNGTAGFHVGMWTTFLTASGRPIVIITTRSATFARLAAEHELPVLYGSARSRRAVAAMFPSSARAAFYVHNGRTGVFLRYRGLRHVFLQHGDSDKETSTTPRALEYDTVVVAGQAAIDRFARNGVEVPAAKFVILGRPQTAEIESVRRPIANVSHPTVLYAPTWKGTAEDTNYSSLLQGPAIVDALLRRGATVIFRPHPAGRRYQPHVDAIAAIKQRLAADAARTGRSHLFGPRAEKVPVAEVANAADAMISDVSGIVTDFMASLKPFAMVATKCDAVTFGQRFPTSTAAYVIEGDLGNLDQALDALLVTDPMADVRVERRGYFLGGYDGVESARAFETFLAQLAGVCPVRTAIGAR